MRKITLAAVALLIGVALAFTHYTTTTTGANAVASWHNAAPLGTRLQNTAGSGYEVIFDPATRIFTVEPRG